MNGGVFGLLKTPILSLRRRPASPALQKAARIVHLVHLALWGLFLVWRVVLYYEVKHELAQVRAAGLPTSGAELNAWLPAVPDANNGALILTQAFALMRTFSDERMGAVTRTTLFARTNRWSPETVQLVEEYVRANAAALARAREALALPQFRYPVDYAYGPDTDTTHLGRLRKLAQMTALQASLDAAVGSGEQWPAHVVFQLQLAGTLAGEPTLLPYLTRAGIIRMAVKATERNLTQSSASPLACVQLEQAFARFGSTNLLPFALRTERSACIPVFRMSWNRLRSFDQDGDAGSRPRQPYSGKSSPLLWLSGFLERDLCFYLHTMDRTIAVAALASVQSLRMTNLLEQAGSAAQRKYYILSSFIIPALTRIALREVTSGVQVQLAIAALATERFRHDQGRWPEDLSELSPKYLAAVPVDFFDGQPLRYRRLPRGYRIYSIGADGHDDGGREPPEIRRPGDTNSYDLTFTVER